MVGLATPVGLLQKEALDILDFASKGGQFDTKSAGTAGEMAKMDFSKIGSLLALVLQNTMLVLSIKHTRSRPNVPLYSVGVAVVMNEVLKILLACVVLSKEYKPREMVGAIYHETVGRPSCFAKMVVPAFLYTAQNYLGYVAISNLQPATYQLLSQMKILTTALFSVVLLGTQLSWTQWGSLHLLIAGVSLVQVSAGSTGDTKITNNLVGGLAVTGICFCSGLAAVYFELILKTTSTSIWMRNIQLGIISFIIGIVNLQLRESAIFKGGNAFSGFDAFVWIVITLQAGGGLLVAAVMKYADNILKCFATSISVILSCLLSVFLFDFQVTPTFVCGAVMIIVSAYLYNKFKLVSQIQPKDSNLSSISATKQQHEESSATSRKSIGNV